MLLFILFAALFAASVIYFVTVFLLWKRKVIKKFGYYYKEAGCFNKIEKATCYLGPLFMILFGLVLFGLALGAILNASLMQLRFNELQLQYNNFVALSQNGSDAILTWTEDIANYNVSILRAQYYDNLWTNWYTNTLVARNLIPFIIGG